jgi:AraC-like DNA-binding protein
MMGDGYLDVTDFYGRYPHLIGMTWPVYFLVGPVFYFHYRELSSPTQLVFSWRQSLTFLPAIASALFLIVLPLIRGNENVARLLSLIAPLEGDTFLVLNAVPYLAALQNTVYFAMCYALIRGYKSGITQSFSAIETSNLSWLRTLLFVVSCQAVLYFILSYVVAPLGIRRESSYLFYLLWACGTFITASKVIIHPEAFSRIEAARRTELRLAGQVMVPAVLDPVSDGSREDNGTSTKEKYRRTWVTNERAAAIARQLLLLMEKEKPFVKPELTLPELADKLAVFPHHLSQVINREMNKSFFDFVNEYRVREAKKLLSSTRYSHLSILGIALEVGFNSKSAFYTAFNKYAGITPSEFRRQLQLSADGIEPDVQS